MRGGYSFSRTGSVSAAGRQGFQRPVGGGPVTPATIRPGQEDV